MFRPQLDGFSATSLEEIMYVWPRLGFCLFWKEGRLQKVLLTYGHIDSDSGRVCSSALCAMVST